MRLYLSSYRLGIAPGALRDLVSGGPRTAVIMNAADAYRSEVSHGYLEREIEDLAAIGLQGEELDLRDYFGNPGELHRALSRCQFVWVVGGNAFVLRRSMERSGFDDVMRRLLDDDQIVYGGYSAGAIVATPTLRGIELVDDPTVVPAGYNAQVVWEGMSLVPYSLAPHYKSGHPESAAMDGVVAYYEREHMAFHALADGQAIVVDGLRQRVVPP